MLFAYLGPDTLLPITSILAAIGGAILMFGRNASRITVLLFRHFLGSLKNLGSSKTSDSEANAASNLRVDQGTDYRAKARRHHETTATTTTAQEEGSSRG